MTHARPIADQVAIARGHVPELPPVPHEGRWLPQRKEAVVHAIETGALTEAQAIEAWGLSADELAGWIRRHARFGRRGLSVSRLQQVGR